MGRVTIKEIARRAGVSKGAVSYALNNQPGVSEATRARVLKVAEELEWVPNRAARQLSAARSETFGLVLARTAKTLSEEPFYMGFVGGVESVLGRSPMRWLCRWCLICRRRWLPTGSGLLSGGLTA